MKHVLVQPPMALPTENLRARSIRTSVEAGVALVVIDAPPVNALDVRGWFDLAETITALGRDASVRALVLAAEGKGFCAGVDIKEIQRSEGHTALLAANRGC